jgi:hypothetical protein
MTSGRGWANGGSVSWLPTNAAGEGVGDMARSSGGAACVNTDIPVPVADAEANATTRRRDAPAAVEPAPVCRGDCQSIRAEVLDATAAIGETVPVPAPALAKSDDAGNDLVPLVRGEWTDDAAATGGTVVLASTEATGNAGEDKRLARVKGEVFSLLRKDELSDWDK